MAKPKLDQATELLSQMVEVSEALDSERRIKEPGSLANGESWMTFHLKALQSLLKEISEDDS